MVKKQELYSDLLNISKGSSLYKHAKKILSYLSEENKKISPLLILTHDYPDPDALASAYALQYISENFFDIQSKIVYDGIIGRMENREMVRILKLPVRKLRKTDLKKYSHVALVDTQPDFQNNPFPKNKRARIVLDQHPSVVKPNSDLSIIDTECGATSVVLTAALLMLGVEIPVRLATALAYGITSDTLNLYRVKQSDVFNVYSSLLAYCDLRALARIQNPDRSRNFFMTLRKGIETATKYRSLLVSNLGEVENPDLVSQVADFLLNYKTAKWTFCTGRYQGKLHMSLRTNIANAQAGEVLRDICENRGEAGGHSSIAGGSFVVGKSKDENFWLECEKQLTHKLMKRVRIPLKTVAYYPFK